MATASIPSLSVDISPRATSLRVERIESLEEIDSLDSDWRELDAHAWNPQAQFLWTRASLAAFAAEEEPRWLAVRDDERVVALAPLVSRRLRGVRRTFITGVGQLHEPADFSWTDPRALAKLVSTLARRGTPLVLERIVADSPTVELLRRAFRHRGVVIARPQAKCPYIELDETWVEPEQHLNSGRRSDLRRARRKAEQWGQVTVEIHTPDLDTLPRLLDVAFDVEGKSWKGDAGTALVRDGRRAVFYRQYAEAACTEGILRICFLRIGGNVAAMQLAVEQAGGFWLLKVGYDERFASCSPGVLLMRDTIRYAAEAGLNTYEFLGKAETWTAVWAKQERATVALWVYPLGVRGMAALAADGISSLASRWRRS